MRKCKLLFIVIVLMLTLAGCKYPTLEKAIAETIPFEVKEVLYKKKSEGITIVLYSTKAEGKEVEHIKEPVLGVSFFEGNDEEGWKNDGPNGWEHAEGETYSIYHENYTKYDDKGNVLKDIYVVFGEINNENIAAIEIANQDTEDYKKAKMIKRDGKRYYVGLGFRPQVRALNGNGEVIPQ
jgi:phosphoribosylaminoimidazole-succinocarboxamide synthase